MFIDKRTWNVSRKYAQIQQEPINIKHGKSKVKKYKHAHNDNEDVFVKSG